MTAINLSYGEYSVDFATLPVATREAIANEGFTHYLGNRVASKVVGHFRAEGRKAFIADNSAEAWKALSKTEQAGIEKAALPDSESDAYLATIKIFRDETFAAMQAGTLGVTERTPSKSPFETEIDKYVKEKVLAILKAQGLWKGAKNPTTDQVFALVSGDRTFQSLLDGFYAKNKAEVDKHANKVLAEREKIRKAAEGVDLESAF